MKLTSWLLFAVATVGTAYYLNSRLPAPVVVVKPPPSGPVAAAAPDLPSDPPRYVAALPVPQELPVAVKRAPTPPAALPEPDPTEALNIAWALSRRLPPVPEAYRDPFPVVVPSFSMRAPLTSSPGTPTQRPLGADPCLLIANVARSAAIVRDSGVPFDWGLREGILLRVIEESQQWRLPNPGEHYTKFLEACRLEGFDEMYRRLREMSVARWQKEQDKQREMAASK